jgi:hypothetical protein
MSTHTTTEAIDVVCVPRAIPLGERVAHFELGRRLFTEMVEERIDLPSGIALRLPGDAFPEVVRFIANERKCCPFLHIEVEIAPGAGPMWLRPTGPPGTRELIEAELALTARGSFAVKSLKWPAVGGIVGVFGIASRCLLPRLSRFRKRGS